VQLHQTGVGVIGERRCRASRRDWLDDLRIQRAHRQRRRKAAKPARHDPKNTTSSTTSSMPSSWQWPRFSTRSTRKYRSAKPKSACRSSCRRSRYWAGSYIKEGKVTRGASVRVKRDVSLYTRARSSNSGARRMMPRSGVGYECGILIPGTSRKSGTSCRLRDQEDAANYLGTKENTSPPSPLSLE